MTTFNTRNPLGSTAVKDLYDNAENFDRAVNGDPTSWKDRLGNTRRSWSSIENSIEDVIANANAAIASLGYQVPVPYAAGIEMTLANQTVSYDGDTYAPIASELPFTTSGSFEADKFRLIQGVSGADLAAPYGAALVGFKQDGLGAIARTLQDKAKEWVSVKDFGAVGDGVTDDSDCFASAFDYSEGMGTPIFIPHGVYVVKNLTLRGPGIYSENGAILKWAAGYEEPMLRIESPVQIRGIVFDGNGTSSSGTPTGIILDGAPGSMISDCRFTNFRFRALVIQDAEATRISGNSFSDTGLIPNGNCMEIKSKGVSVVGNTFERVGDAHCIRVGYFPDDSPREVTGVTIVGNTFKDSEHVGITCELGTRFCSISGNTFDSVEAGVKLDNVVCSDISIVGNTFKDLTNTVGTAFNLTAPRTVFKSNIISNCISGPQMNGGVVEGNIFYNCGRAGGYLINHSSTGPDNLIKGNIFYSTIGNVINASGLSRVVDNFIDGATQWGVRIQGEHVEVVGNVFRGIAGSGVRIQPNTESARIEKNTFVDVSDAFSNTSLTPAKIIIQDNYGVDDTPRTASIQSGSVAIHPSDKVLILDTEGSTPEDDLDNIEPASQGQLVVLRIAVSARKVTVRRSIGNIQMGSDCLLDHSGSTLTLCYSGSLWREVARSLA